MTLLDFILRAFAVYRVSTDVTMKDGPFHLFKRGRHLLIDLGLPADGVSCPVCVSFWVALLALVAPAWLLRWLGTAGAAVWLWRMAIVHEA